MAGGEQHDGASTAKPPEVSITRLPTIASAIYGRGADTAWLDACWEEGAHVASIVAFGGVGKSALVWDWLRGMQRDGWRGAERVYGWSFYSQGTTDRMTSADEFVSAGLRWFGDADPNAGSPWDKGERLARLIKERRTLLVLDGVEPLQWGPGAEEGKIKDPALSTLVRELGAQNKGLCVLTSRLAVREVGDFAPEKCRRLDLAKLTEEAGAELLRARGVTGAEEDLREAVREYGGHGLALALLGSYLEEVGEGNVRRRHEIGPLVEDERLGGHARRVMSAYERMFGGGSAEVALLRMLGLFDRPADEGEVGALRAEPVIAGLTDAIVGIGRREWNRAVARLRRVGLVARAAGDKDRKVDAHPLVREHFRAQVRHEQEDAWREGHRRLYEHLKGKAKELPETVEEMAPLYAAVAHGCEAGKTQEALDDVLWKRIHREGEGFDLKKLGAFSSEAALLSAFFDPPWERLLPGLAESDQAVVMSNAGFVLRALGRLPEAMDLTRVALERLIAQKDWKNASQAAANISELLQARGELSDAEVSARQSVELADKSGKAFERMAFRTSLAGTLHAMGLRDEAAAQFNEAEHIQREWDPPHPMLCSVPGFLACDLLLEQGKDAEVRARAAQTLLWEKGRLLDIALDHLSLGRAYLLAVPRGTASDLAEAITHLQQAVDGLRRASYQEMLLRGLLARAVLHTHTRAFDLARHDLDEALSVATRCGFRLHESDAHLGQARLCLAQSDPVAAVPHLASARKLIEETGYHRRDEELAALEGEAREMAQIIPPPVTPLMPVTTPVPAPVAERGHSPMPPNETPVDFLLITAIEQERDALLSKLSGVRKLDRDGTGTHTYYEATVATRRQDGAVYRVLVTSLSGMGPIKGAIKAGAVIQRWKPTHVLMVGIAGGVEGEVAPGDVMVASLVADYTVGKVRDDAPRETRWMPYPADADLLDAAANFPSGWEDLIASAPPEPATPQRRIGIIASGGDVIASKEQIRIYLAEWPKLIGVEMEGGGVAAGLHDDIARPRFLMIRGASDLANGEDNAGMKKAWKAYACHVAAAYAIGLLRDGPVQASQRSATQNPR